MSVLVNHFELGRHSVSRNSTWFHKFNHSHRGIGGGLWFDHFVHFLRMDQTCKKGAKLDNKKLHIYIYIYVHNSYIYLKMGYSIDQIWWLIILFSFSNDHFGIKFWVIWLHLRTPAKTIQVGPPFTIAELGEHNSRTYGLWFICIYIYNIHVYIYIYLYISIYIYIIYIYTYRV